MLISIFCLIIAVLLVLLWQQRREHQATLARLVSHTERHVAQLYQLMPHHLEAAPANRLADLMAILEMINEAVALVDRKGHITYCNPAFLGHLGKSKLPPHTSLHSLVDPVAGKQISDFLSQHANNQSLSLTLTLPHQPESPVNLLISPVPDDKGKILYNLIYLTNEAFLSDLRRKVETSQQLEALGELTGGIIHDLNNLIYIIQIAMNITLEDFKGDLQARQFIESADLAGKKAGLLLRQVLLHFREIRNPSHHCDAIKVSRELVDLNTQIYADTAKVRLESNLAQLPLQIGVSSLQQIIMNLLNNAIQAASKGRGEIIIRIGRDFDPNGQQCGKIQVIDNGIGIPKSKQQAVFEPFFTTKPAGVGTGLGLYMVKSLMNQSNGTIHLDSEEGKGTTFTLWLPLAQEEPNPKAPPAQITPAQSKRILLLEGDEAFCKSLEFFLLNQGFKVEALDRSQAALNLLHRHAKSVDLVILGSLIPTDQGHDLCLRIKRLWPQLAILLIAEPQIELNPQLRQPCDAIVRKPFEFNSLLESIRVLLHLS